MSKYCSENERVKRQYAFRLKAVSGKQDSTVSAALKAISRFETTTNHMAFKKFHIEQARSFRSRLVDEPGHGGRPLSSATIAATLTHIQRFFRWLSQEPGYRSALNANDADYFSPTEQDVRIASARRERAVASLDDIKRVLALMPSGTAIEKRDRALIAFAILSNARDAALASFRLKHVNLAERTVFQDAREVDTKRRKTFTSDFFPVGPEAVAIVADYLHFLKVELGFGQDDPLFPSTLVKQGETRGFEAQGLSRRPWTTTAPIRAVFHKAFVGAGLPYANPHSFRRTLALHMDGLNLTLEEEKAMSQNFGHDHVRTTREYYGALPDHRRRAIMRRLDAPRSNQLWNEEIVAMEALLNRLKAGQTD